jgi:hypothetical protein
LTLSAANNFPAILKTAVFEVTSYRFGVENQPVAGGGNGGLGGGKTAADPVVITVRESAPVAGLFTMLLTGAHADTAVLSLPDPTGKKVFATFNTVAASSLDSVAGSDGQLETVTFETGGIDLAYAGITAGWDTLKNQGTCNGACCNSTSYGTYAQAEPTWPIAASTTRIDELDVPVVNAPVAGGGNGGLGGNKASTQGFTIRGPLESNGVCSTYRTGQPLTAPTTFDVESPLSTKFGPLDTTIYTAVCGTVVTSLTITSSATGPREEFSLNVGAFQVTERTLDATTGTTANESTTSWSFLRNQATAVCQ